MHIDTRTVEVSDTWTLITNKTALIQFNDEMYLAITHGTVPTESVGFIMQKYEKHLNGGDRLSVWAKSIYGGTNIESVRIMEVVE